MRKIFVLLAAILLSASYTFAQDSLTTLILFRHAERANDGTQDPDISPAGYERAKKIVTILGDTKIDALYSTNLKRTRNTVAALAEAKKLPVQTYEPMNGAALDKILQENQGKTIVMVGHSNTTPWVVNYLLGEQRYKNFADDDYNNLLILTVPSNKKATKVVWIDY